MRNIFRKKNDKLNGYSFIEGVFATFIVGIGMLAVLKLMSSTISADADSRNQTVGTFLAQEGVEVVRGIRDNNWAKGNPTFDYSGPFPATSSNNCLVSYDSTSILCSSSDKTVHRNETTKVYSANASDPETIFKRKVVIDYYDENGNGTDAANAFSAQVTSFVVWNSSTPIGSANESNCKLLSDCVFVSVVLNKWGGND